MARMTRPPEITVDEWEMLTSPENYYMDGEVSRSQADQIFRQRVKSIVTQRRAKNASVRTPAHAAAPSRRCSARTTSGSQCDRDAKRGFAFCWQHQNSGQNRAR